MRVIKYLAAAAFATCAAGTASALTVPLVLNSTNPASPEAIGSVPGQDFESELTAANADHLYSGPLTLDLGAGYFRLEFSLVAAESGFSNTFNFGTDSITENRTNSGVSDFLTDAALDGEAFTVFMGGGLDIATMMSFDNGQGDTFDASDHGFGIFADKNEIGHLSTFFLALDDGGGTDQFGNPVDDNHDDIIVRVQVAAVPLPAAGWMLLAGLGGLFGMRRFRRTA